MCIYAQTHTHKCVFVCVCVCVCVTVSPPGCLAYEKVYSN